jgi:tetratricopeptide (TPR) repeat protein
MIFSPPHRVQNTPTFLTSLICLAFIFCLVAVAYSHIFHGAFFYDDDALITQNSFLRDWQNLPTLFTTFLSAGSNQGSTYYRPLQSVLYLAVYQWAGLSTTAYHGLNLALHMVSAGLMMWLGQKLKFNVVGVFCATLLWAVHPIHTEAVTYISATADTLYTMFCLLAVIAALPNFSKKRMAASGLFLALALLSKETAIALPLLIASLIYYSTTERFRMGSYLRVIPLAVLVAFYAFIHLWAVMEQPKGTLVAMKEPTAIASLMPFATLPHYLGLLIWPSHLYMEHNISSDSSWWFLALAVGFALVIAASLQIGRKQTALSLPLSWGLLWFIAALLPVFYVKNIVYEHWMYLPTIGLFLGIAETLARFMSSHRSKQITSLLITVVVGLACVLAYLTFQQNKFWQSPVTFYQHIIDQGVESPKAHANLGAYYSQHGDFDKALQEYDLAIQQSGDGQAEVQNDIALTLMAMPDAEQHTDIIQKHFERALAINPNLYGALEAIANYMERRGQTDKAALYRQRAADLRQNYKTNLTPYNTKDSP